MVTIIKKYTGGAYPYYEYACLSTDVKPVNLVPENSTCHEIDTGKHFYLANGEWHEAPGRGGGSGGGGDIEFVEIELSENEQTGEPEFVLKSTLAAVYEAAQTKAVIGYCNVIDENYAQTIHFPFIMAVSVVSEGVQRYMLQFGGEMGEDATSVTITFDNSTVGSLEEEGNDLPNGSNDGDLLVWDDDYYEWRVKSDTKAPVIVRLTEEDKTSGFYVGDKTFGEVYAAMGEGKNVVLSGTLEAPMKIVPSGIVLDDSTYKLTIPYNGQFVVLQGAENDSITVTVGG